MITYSVFGLNMQRTWMSLLIHFIDKVHFTVSTDVAYGDTYPQKAEFVFMHLLGEVFAQI